MLILAFEIHIIYFTIIFPFQPIVPHYTDYGENSDNLNNDGNYDNYENQPQQYPDYGERTNVAPTGKQTVDIFFFCIV